MDKKKSVLNVGVSIFFKIILLLTNIVVRRFLIKYIGNEINGLHSLYISLLDFLSVAELGVGSAITFCMYKPIVEGDRDKVSALYGLFTKLYYVIGAIILICGCALMPALPFLAKDYQNVSVNLYYTFGLMLDSVVLSYVFCSKTSLINAYKNNYITTLISSCGQLLQYVLQIIVLICSGSFVWFLICRIITIVIQWIVTEWLARWKYHSIINNKQPIDSETRKDVTKNVKAMFMHKIGTVLVNTTDSLIISAFLGIVLLGKYSNYTVIMLAMTGILALCFTPLTSIIGHMCVEESKESVRKYYNFFYTFNFLLGIVFFLGYYAVIDNLVAICFGDGLQMDKSVSLVITVNYFIQFMRQSTVLFRDATGTFYNDRWKPLLEGIVNIILSVGFVYLFQYVLGNDFAVIGVIVATIITNLFISHIVEPYVLFKYALDSSVRKHYLKNYLYMIFFVGLLLALHFTMITNESQWMELLANGGISLAYSFVFSILIIAVNKDFRHYINSFVKRRKSIAAECDTDKT